MTIYITAFTYLSECYGIYASSAIAGQSFCRNMMGGAFSFFTTAMFDRLTVRWGLVMMGGFASVLALVPFIASSTVQSSAHIRHTRSSLWRWSGNAFRTKRLRGRREG